MWMDAKGQTKTYELNTVTFGVASADNKSENFPEAALRIKRDIYVDDLLTGTDSFETAMSLHNEIDVLLERGELNLRQWASNGPRLLENLPEGSFNLQLKTDKEATIKTLGVHWNSQRDAIVYTVKPMPTASKVTKRSILSKMAKIFDPLGLLGPVILQGKIIMQKLEGTIAVGRSCTIEC
ncbi:uncharacterized protein LOC107045591 [Diachasma alloeum]|uniref:uncharacterized protein LOC107045591 n=1 Tax=Diachasma alloeum TaxID=454923 RepID=UPI0007383A8C|nr:uncharacterized protein LOC107045591 [Diachasma alloeum]